MSNINPNQLGGTTVQAASTYSKYIQWGMILGGLYFFGPGASIFQYGAYGVLFFLGMLYYQQDGLLYACNHPSIPKRASQNPALFRNPGERGMEYRTLNIRTSDACVLHGWLMTVPGGTVKSTKAPTIVYFHGNAGNLGLRLPLYEELYFRLGCNVIAFDYRGYGDSTGKPNEEGLQLDALALRKYIHNELREFIDPSTIFLFGRSLGGSVATWLASQKFTNGEMNNAGGINDNVKGAGDKNGIVDREGGNEEHFGIHGLIIENTFTSVGDLAIKLFSLLKLFKFLLPLLVKSKWLAKEDIKQVKVPIMLLSAQMDLLVPPKHMATLFKNAPDENELTRIHRFFLGGHNDTPIKEPEKYYQAFINYFNDLGLTFSPLKRPENNNNNITEEAKRLAAARMLSTKITEDNQRKANEKTEKTT
jgi:pimeloyl-ACP methyl ester carboxylesterase